MDAQRSPENRLPPLPERPTPSRPTQGSPWSILLAGVTGLTLFIGFIFLAAPLGGIVLGVGVIVGGIFVVAFLHYLLWGRWLSQSIREEVEAEEREEEIRRHGKDNLHLGD